MILFFLICIFSIHFHTYIIFNVLNKKPHQEEQHLLQQQQEAEGVMGTIARESAGAYKAMIDWAMNLFSPQDQDQGQNQGQGEPEQIATVPGQAQPATGGEAPLPELFSARTDVPASNTV
jgi:hypothetical protein